MAIISNIFSSEIILHINVKFYVEPFWERGTLIYQNGLGHMTKMAIMLICQYLYTLLLQSKKSHDVETRHGPSGTQETQRLYK